jgi:hypothetical protein
MVLASTKLAASPSPVGVVARGGRRRIRRAAFEALAFAVVTSVGAHAAAATCYQQPFGNPNLGDGWHSTCCGRTNPHQGVDYPQAKNTPIPAVADGTIALVQSSGCLGNVVVIAHPDGMFSGYSHLVAPGPLPVGTPVSRGQTIGYVGATGSCAQGAHLHLTMANTVGGYGNGNNVDPYAWIEAHKVCNQAPIGSLDETSCEAVRGWAFDPDAGAGAIAAHVYYGGPAGQGHPAQALVADQNRDDLCPVVGSCNHGYSTPPPLSLLDGQPHEVHAYAIDSTGGPNPELPNSPRTLTCAAPALTGVKRWIENPTVLASWKLDSFLDQLAVPVATVDALPEGSKLPAAPMMVKSADEATVYLVDGSLKRPIPNPGVVTAWHLAWDQLQIKTSAELAALETGPALRLRPTMVADSKGRLLVVDDEAPASAGAGGGAGAAGAAGRADGGSAGSAGSAHAGDGGTASAAGGGQQAPGGTAGAAAGGRRGGERGGERGGGRRSNEVAIGDEAADDGSCSLPASGALGAARASGWPKLLVACSMLAAAWVARARRRRPGHVCR